MMNESITISAAVIAGLLSFFSPCVLPLIPAYFTFISGFSLEELTDSRSKNIRQRVVMSTLSFVVGFSVVFILLGASASYLGSLIQEGSQWIRIVGGALIILLGLHLTGLLPIQFLNVEKRLHVKQKPLHFAGSFLVGMAFGAGWSPCIGPLLGSILILAGNQDTVGQGVFLLSMYSLGLALPFLIISVFVNWILRFLQSARRWIRPMNITAGVLLMAMGTVLITDRMSLLMNWVYRFWS